MANRVLVVDDDPGIRSMLRRLLTAQGLEVLTAPDGESGLSVFRESDPGVVLLDVMMPGLNGFEVCERLKSDPETRLTPVVMITGLGDTGDRVRGIEAGADDFLSKPFDHVELVTRVKSLLRVRSFTDELERAEVVLLTLARALEGRDAYTQGHCEWLAGYGGALAERLGLPDEEVMAVRRAGVVHDIGKVTVPDAILLKSGPLTAEEFAIMQEHPVTGEDICRPLKAFRLVLPIIRHHHEKMDGSGYPDGLAGGDVPLTARVLQVVDVFDALTTERPYKTAMTSEQALETLEAEVGKGWWDGDVVGEFVGLIGEGVAIESVAVQ